MNVSEYIQSGILDLYVLGGLSASDAADVEKMAAIYPEIAVEIDFIHQTLEKLAMSEQVAPPLSLKSKIMEAIPESDLEDNSSKINVPNYTYLWAIAASWLVILVVGGLAYHYRNQWKQTESRLAVLETQKQELASRFDLTKFGYEQASKKLNLIADTSFKRVPLKKLPQVQEAFAQVWWDRKQGQVFMDAHYLPKVPPGRQYQLWAIVDGKPVDAGVIPLTGEQDVIEMKNIQNASAFAITLEQQGGSANPTMDQMYVMGGV